MDNSSLFRKRMDQLGIGRQVDAAMIVAKSQRLIHDKFGALGDENLRVVSYRKGVLKIASTSSAWSAECRGIMTQLLENPVERVIFVLGGYREE